MDQGRIERASKLLAEARRGRRKLSGLPDNARPASVAEGLAVQEAVSRLQDVKPGAWKVGGPPSAGTTYAPIYPGDVTDSPATLELSIRGDVQIEGEIAFRMSKDLPVEGRPYAPERVAGAVESVCAVIEIGESRYTDFEAVSIPEKVADNLGNGGLVVGSATASWDRLKWDTLHVTMHVNGGRLIDRPGGKPGKTPFALLLWAAHNCIAPRGLQIGDLVTTGSWTGAYRTRPGDEIVVAFEHVGTVSLRCL